MKKQFLALFSAVLLGVGLIPSGVLADEGNMSGEEIAAAMEVTGTEQSEEDLSDLSGGEIPADDALNEALWEACDEAEEQADGTSAEEKQGEENSENETGSEIPENEAETEISRDETDEEQKPAVLSNAAAYALPSDNRKTATWTYSSGTYTEFYVTAYAEDTQEELSFRMSYNRTSQVTTYVVDVGDLTDSVTDLSDGKNEYVYSYATVYGIDYEIYQNDSSAKEDESRWSTLGSEERPVTSIRITKDNTQSAAWTLWQYAVYSGDELLGTIGVRAHDNAAYPYIYLQLWCSKGEIVAVNENTGEGYTNLQAAIGEASAGDTVTLCADLNVPVESENQFAIDRDLTLDLGGHTITADCADGRYHLFSVAAGTEAVIKNGTIDGGDPHALGYAVYGDGTASSLTGVTLDRLTIRNFGAASQYGTVYVYNGSLNASDCKFLNNGNSAVSVMSSAGDNSVYEGTALILDGCEISGNVNAANSYNLYGGGIGACQIAKVSVKNCTVTGNQFLGSGLYGGGGVSVYNAGEIELVNNVISKNTSASYGGGVFLFNGSYFTDGDQTTVTDNVITDNEASMNGGGLTYYSNAKEHTVSAGCVFSGNHIDNNHTFYDGGGMSMYSNDPDFEFTILSGTVCDNIADQWSGGIDFGFETLSTLRLYSAVVTDNSAFQGGGVWMCSTAASSMFVTYGGAIYGNSTIDSNVTPSCGDEIRFRGDIDGDSFDGTVVKISPRALGGMRMDWYTDESDARYKDGRGTLVDVTEESYQNRTTAFSLHGELSAEGITLASEAAATVISGNAANYGYGGGISANAGLVFGEDTEISVTALKEWKDEDGNLITSGELPVDSVEITLVRISDDGSRADLETVTLGEENGWMWTFESLPTNYTYEVREDTLTEGYAPSYTLETDGEGNEVITVTNEPNSPEPEEPEPDDTVPGDGTPDNPNPSSPNEPEPNGPDAGTPSGGNPAGSTPGGGATSASSAVTGDTGPFYIWIIVLAAGGLLIIGAVILRVKKSGRHRE